MLLQLPSAPHPGKLRSKAGVTEEILLLFCCSLQNWRSSETLCLSSPKSFLRGSNEKLSRGLHRMLFSCRLHSLHKYLCIWRLQFRLLHIRGNFRTRLSRCNSTDNSHLHPNLNLSPVEPYHSKVRSGNTCHAAARKVLCEEENVCFIVRLYMTDHGGASLYNVLNEEVSGEGPLSQFNLVLILHKVPAKEY